MRYEVGSDRGRAGYWGYCGERGCRHREFGDTKRKAAKAVEEHDKKVHAPEREAAKKAEQRKKDEEKAARERKRAEAQEKADEKKAAKQAKKDGGIAKKGRNGWDIITDPKDPRLSWSERRKLKEYLRKQRYDELKGKVGAHNAAILAELDETPASKIPQIKGLRTYGLEKYGIPDGQNVNGLVYDKDGNRVTHDTLRRFVQGWGD